METSVDLVAEEKETKHQLEQKLYLVACYKSEDAIDSMQQMYLKLKVDYGDRPLMFNLKEKYIIGNSIKILFKTQRQLKLLDAYQFFGVGKNSKFNGFSHSLAKNLYWKNLETTRALYGVNDRDGLLRMYLKGKK